MWRCGNEVLMHRSKPDVNWSNYYSVCFVSFLLSTNLMLNRDKTKKRKEKMWVERLSFVFVYTCTLSFLNADAPFQINLCSNTHAQSNKHDHYTYTLYVSKLPYLFHLVASLDIYMYIYSLILFNTFFLFLFLYWFNVF
jgi:hypothetical protein